MSAAAQDELLRQYHDEELRVLLVHYGYAEKGRDAARWSRAEMVETIAEHMVEVEGA